MAVSRAPCAFPSSRCSPPRGKASRPGGGRDPEGDDVQRALRRAGPVRRHPRPAGPRAAGRAGAAGVPRAGDRRPPEPGRRRAGRAGRRLPRPPGHLPAARQRPALPRGVASRRPLRSIQIHNDPRHIGHCLVQCQFDCGGARDPLRHALRRAPRERTARRGPLPARAARPDHLPRGPVPARRRSQLAVAQGPVSRGPRGPAARRRVRTSTATRRAST